MYAGFNGEFRRKPVVSIRGVGASKKETKEDLVKRLKEERAERERHRLENTSSERIQSCFRSYLVRRRLHQVWRGLLERQLAEIKKLNDKDEVGLVKKLTAAVGRAAAMFQGGGLKKDGGDKILADVCQISVKHRAALSKMMAEDSQWVYRVAAIMKACLASFKHSAASSGENINPQLRMMEVFSSSNLVFRYLLSNDLYYSGLRTLCDSRIPSSLTEETLQPPTPIAELVVALIMNPLVHVAANPKSATRTRAFRSLTAEFFARPLSPQVRFYVLPVLSHSTAFPDAEWISAVGAATSDDSRRSTVDLLLSILRLTKSSMGKYSEAEKACVLAVLSRVMGEMEEEGQSGDAMECDNGGGGSMEECIELLNDKEFVNAAVSTAEKSSASDSGPDSSLVHLCRISHRLLLSNANALYEYRLLHTMAFNSSLLVRLWGRILRERQITAYAKNAQPLLSVLARGIRLTAAESASIVPMLVVFAALFGYLLVTIHDTEFYGNVAGAWMPFSLADLIPMSLALRDVGLGLIELAFPESRPSLEGGYDLAVRSVKGPAAPAGEGAGAGPSSATWSYLFNKVVGLLRQLYARDTRRQFCPAEHWICGNIALPVKRSAEQSFRNVGRMTPFQNFRLQLVPEEGEGAGGPPLTTREIRVATILRELPYSISFADRALIFQNLVTKHKTEHQGDRVHFMQGPSINIHVRRNFLYEDSFDKLSPENEPNMCLKMRVQMTNFAGLDEAGIDGGGLFREFLSELLKTAFDPNRGFFKLTDDQQLYPNPNVALIEGNFVPHYYFIGRMLGKSLYENQLVELPLAGFFLSKLLAQETINIDHLSSLDPELYKNLLYLKTYKGNVEDLGLDFTVVSEELGKTRVEDLKPNGSSIMVSNDNIIEYIHLVADYKLNRQIKAQCNAFRSGLSDVIDLDWLLMLSYRELQTLISGSEREIDISDLRAHTVYGNGFEANHPTIEMFWRAVASMDENKRRLLLRFVTSCSKPPLLGFREMEPPFCIQNGGAEVRLPTASTCMNLLKLPEFKEEKLLREKLFYAIEAGSGFELS